MKTIICEICGAAFNVKPYRETSARFCSKKCGGSWHASTRLARIPKPWNRGNKHAAGQPANATAFAPGQAPWNKGMKGIRLSPASEFKKGRESDKKAPIGTVSIRADKAGTPRAHVKTETGAWRLRAVVAWEKANGPVPSGLVVHHIDGDALNDCAGNLEALTRAEHMKRHRPTLERR